MFGDLVISTSVVIGRCDTEFDINSLYSYLTIDDNIVMVKCNNKQKTRTAEVECKTFYNQISITMNDKKNLKLFNNGKFQVSGVKSVEEARVLVNTILEKTKKIKGDITISPQKYKGFYVYKNKILSKMEDGSIVCVNLIKDDKIIIDNKEVELFDIIDHNYGNIYIDKKHENKTKKIYNNTCKQIGILSYNMKRKSKNLCIKDTKIIQSCSSGGLSWDIMKKNMQVGTLDIDINEPTIPELVLNDKETLTYIGCSINASIQEISLANSNSNIRIVLQQGESLDRDIIVSYLKSKGIEVIYNPSEYPGVKFLLSKTKVTIFRTGSILFSSKENVQEMVLPFLKKMFEEENLVKNHQCREALDQQNSLSIWDI